MAYSVRRATSIEFLAKDSYYDKVKLYFIDDSVRPWSSAHVTIRRASRLRDLMCEVLYATC